MSCYTCHTITLYDLNKGERIKAYQSEAVSPGKICLAGANELCATNKKKIVVFDIITTEFKIKREIDTGILADSLCYFTLPKVGGVLVTTEGCPFYKADAIDINTGKLLFRIGGRDCDGLEQKVIGCFWRPLGICAHGTRLYAADLKNKRIVVINGVTGRVAQILAPPRLGKILDTVWCHKENHLVVQHELDDKCLMSYFELY